jgi:hypothetical protein
MADITEPMEPMAARGSTEAVSFVSINFFAVSSRSTGFAEVIFLAGKMTKGGSMESEQYLK